MGFDLFGDGSNIELKPIEKKKALYKISKIEFFDNPINNSCVAIEELEVTRETPKRLYFENTYHSTITKDELDSTNFSNTPYYTSKTEHKDLLPIVEKVIRYKILGIVKKMEVLSNNKAVYENSLQKVLAMEEKV